MNIKHLDAFFSVAEHGSFSAAADAMFISSPALQQQINRLEGEIGFRLLERGPGGVELTEAGKIFLDEAKKSVKRLDELLSRCREVDSGKRSIRVGAILGMQPDLFPRISGAFREAYPQVLQMPVMEREEQLFADLDKGQLDVVEYYDGVRARVPGRCYLPLIWEGRDCVMSPNHPLAGRKELTLDDLRGQRVVVYRFERVAGLREYLETHYPDIQFSEGNKTPDYYSLLRIFEDGRISLLPPHCKDAFSTLAVVPLKQDMRWSTGLVYRENPSPVVRQFLSVAKAVFGPKDGSEAE
ncbi:MAG: LysR family transcriptional regulator [Clostridia bacterium]|nr:LysR family transcriptional regulator [Clostridia bacterium]